MCTSDVPTTAELAEGAKKKKKKRGWWSTLASPGTLRVTMIQTQFRATKNANVWFIHESAAINTKINT